MVARNGSSLNYLLGDHLGSQAITTDSYGNKTGEIRYMPWGTERYTWGSTPTTYNFTGQRLEASLGLLFYNARWYDAYLNRWIQPDNIIPDTYNSQNFDRYAYALNNPVIYIDPSGHDSTCSTYLDGQCARWSDNRPVINPRAKPYFEVLPINPNDLEGVQWFGGTQRAYDLYTNGDDIYAYCQYAHCGLDLLAPYGTPVYAGVYGYVEWVWSPETGRSLYEGPWKVLINVGDYDIAYGHTDGSAYVKAGDFVTPDTLITGAGNMGGYDGSGEINHIHLEIRGPGGWGDGASRNPLLFMSDENITMLADVAKAQEIQIEMSRYSDGKYTYNYPPPSFLMPSYIIRGLSNNIWK